MGRRVSLNRKGLSALMHSDGIGAVLERVGAPVLAEAEKDPNEFYRSTLRMRLFHSSGPRGRVVVQIGAAPIIGGRVEAKRGTLARAIRRAG